MSREAEKKRLIELIKEGDRAFSDKYANKVMSHIDEIYEFVVDHLLENGVIVPPCKVGDKVYLLTIADLIGEAEISEFKVVLKTLSGVDISIKGFGEFGKTVFFSKEEAEYVKKLRRSVSLVNGHIEE